MSALASTGSMDSMMNVSGGLILSSGRPSQTALIVCLLQPLWMRRSSAVMEDCLQISSQWSRSGEL